MLLDLDRQAGEDVQFTLPDGREIRLCVLHVGRKVVSLGIDAPLDVRIVRAELLKEKKRV